LLETKREQYEKAKAATQILLDIAKRKKPNSANQLKAPLFVLIPKGRTVIERINTAIAQAQISIDLVLSWKRFSRGIVSTFAETMEVAWAKKVKFRFIVESPLENKTAKQLIQFCREKLGCHMRFIPNIPDTVFSVFDKREVFIIVFAKADLPSSPALWSTNRSLIALAQNYFEMLWLEAMESNH
jgi:sugar-specific transcriptional regulator TrmB